MEGGVPGGVVGGIIGGLPEALRRLRRRAWCAWAETSALPSRSIRVDPQYPDLARQGRIQGIVVIEAHVGLDGRVKEARVLRGIPLLDDAALSAVRQWRYQPLLLNGQPFEFLLTVTLKFNLISSE